MNFKRYNESDNSWTDSHYIKKTATDTITTLPATIYPLAQSVTIGLKGNTVQNGTPTPDNPVMPQGTGKRTGNLLDVDSWYRDYKQPDGTYQATRAQLYAIKIKPFTSDDIGKTFTFAMNIAPVSGNVRVTANNGGTVTNGDSAARSVVTFTVASVDDTIYFNYGSFGDTTTTISNIMLNSGSTAKPYEPFGYKIPISCGHQTETVYLGNVQTVRQISKYIVTGNEDISDYDTQYSRFIIQFADITSFGVRITPCLSSDYIGIYDGRPIAQVPNGAIYTGSAGTHSIYVKTTAYTDKSAFISYLQSRFAANDPVVIYFALSTPETAAVNEPLQKIGSYADSISGISIPTTARANTLDVQTTLKPSEVTATFNGWHPVSSAHERESGSWD